MLQGKKAFVFGVLNDYSLGWHIARELHQQGCELAFSHMPGEKFERRVVKAVEPFKPRFLVPCDVTKDEDIAAAFKAASENFGTFDFLNSTPGFPLPRRVFSKPFLEKPAGRAWQMAFWTWLFSAAHRPGPSRAAANECGQEASSPCSYSGRREVYPQLQHDGGRQGQHAGECTVRYLAAEARA